MSFEWVVHGICSFNYCFKIVLKSGDRMWAARVWTLKLGFKTISRSIVKFFLSHFNKADILKCLVCTQDTEEIGKHKIVHSQVWSLGATPRIWTIEGAPVLAQILLETGPQASRVFSGEYNKVIGLSYCFKVPLLHQGAMIVELWHLFSFIMSQEEKAAGFFSSEF